MFPPAPNRVGQLGQHFVPKTLENATVAIEPRNRNPAEAVQDRPFRRMRFQVAAVVRDPGQAEFLQSPVNPFVDLAAHLAEARPAQPKPRHRPLQEFSALLIRHCVPAPLERLPDLSREAIEWR